MFLIEAVLCLPSLPHFILPFRSVPKSEYDLSDDPGCETVFPKEIGCEESDQRKKLSAPSHTHAPKPAPRSTPPPERVKTQAYLLPELPPCGDTHMSIPAVSDDGVIHVMTLQAGM